MKSRPILPDGIGKRRQGFSLIELLLGIAIIGMLTALMLPAILTARGAARRTECTNNLRQIGIAINAYAARFDELPPGQFRGAPRHTNKHADEYTYSWCVRLLNDLDERNLARQINTRLPMSDVGNHEALSHPIPVFLCPSTSQLHKNRSDENRIAVKLPDELGRLKETALAIKTATGLAPIDYLAVSGAHKKVEYAPGRTYGPNTGVFLSIGDPLDDKGRMAGKQYGRPVRLEMIKDGFGKTMAVTECTGQGWDDESHGIWGLGANIGSVGRMMKDPERGPVPASINMSDRKKAWENEEPRSDHPGGVYALMCDGRVIFLTNDTSVKVIREMATRDGRERFGEGSSR